MTSSIHNLSPSLSDELRPETALIWIKDWTHRWSETCILSISHWSVPVGKSVALSGPSGSGKSTLLKVLSGLIEVQQGEVWVLGTPLHLLNDNQRRAWRAQKLGLIAQELHQFFHLNINDHLRLKDRLSLGQSLTSITEQTLINALAEVDLEDRLWDFPHQLSFGQQQRVHAVQAWLYNPPFLCADEPTAHLDPDLSQLMITLLKKKYDQGLFVVTHDPLIAQQCDDSISILDLLTSNTLDQNRSPSPSDLLVNVPEGCQTDYSLPSPPSLTWVQALWLASKALLFYRKRTLLLFFSLFLALFLPLGLTHLTQNYTQLQRQRAIQTDLIVGGQGNRYDLVLASLYFQNHTLNDLPYRLVDEWNQSNLAIPIPLHLKWSARSVPLVGTSPEYYEYRNLILQQGYFPYRLGEVALGSRAADQLQVKIGDQIMSDQLDLYDLSAQYPTPLKVVGILKVTQSPDDHAGFISLKTAWLIEGIGHGHQKVKDQAQASLVLDQDRLSRVHFHGDPQNFPISALILNPHSTKAKSLIQVRQSTKQEWKVYIPLTVMNHLLNLILKIQSFFSLLFGVLLVGTLLLAFFVMQLSFKMRSQEWLTFQVIGLSSLSIFKLKWMEGLLIIIGVIAILNVSLLGLTQWGTDELQHLLHFFMKNSL